MFFFSPYFWRIYLFEIFDFSIQLQTKQEEMKQGLQNKYILEL